jgi:hypothetical protein
MRRATNLSLLLRLHPLAALFALLVALFVVGCGTAASADKSGTAETAGMQSRSQTTQAGAMPYAEEAPVAQAAPTPPMAPGMPGSVPPSRADTPSGGGGLGGAGAALAEQAGREPLLVYTAHLTMAVFDAKKALDTMEDLTRKSEGYLVRRDDLTITVRVPSKRFQASLDEMMRLGDVLHRRVDVRDVTEEYTDIVVRLRNAEAMRKRLEELLARAENVKHALEVERELERVAGEIERMKGRLKLLGELVSFSTITVEFRPRTSDHVESSVKLPFPWLERLGLGDLLRL